MAKIYIVGTPIGNMNDITIRALETLKRVDYVACEDTRVVRKIFSRFGIVLPKLIVYNEHNKMHAVPKIINLALDGQMVAQVSNAGMPVVNDPGYLLVKSAIKQDVEVVVIPGVSAVTMVHVLANFGPHFTFHGFLHYKSHQRQKQLQNLAVGTHIFFLTPHRFASELSAIEKAYGPQVEVFLGRELTKKFETHYRGTIANLTTSLPQTLKGELVLAIKIISKGWGNDS